MAHMDSSGYQQSPSLWDPKRRKFKTLWGLCPQSSSKARGDQHVQRWGFLLMGTSQRYYCFPIKNGVFLEDWNGSPFFKEPSNMLFYNESVTLQMCHIAGLQLSSRSRQPSQNRCDALCIAGNALAKATVHGWVVMVPGLEGRNAGTAQGQAQRKQTWGMLYPLVN